jgi:hypothetical protein
LVAVRLRRIDIAGGKIAEERSMYDLHAILQQVGVRG